MLTTTYGTGQLIGAALEAGAARVIIGIGGSATTDGGAGAAQALGAEFLDAAGRVIREPLTGGGLAAVAGIRSRLTFGENDSRPLFLVACDVDNPLCGPRGAAAVYGPQKGATPEQVQALDRNLACLADIIERDLGKNVRDFPGAGAAGGMGAGLAAFLDARLDRGIRIVMDAVRFEERIHGADLIITGEGRLDRQSMMGKVIAGVGRAGKAAGVPVVALVGCIGEGAETALELLQGYYPINPPGTPLAEALARTGKALEATAAALLAETLSLPEGGRDARPPT
jgi:glycerate kinase